jgi:hypothetical protein
MPLKDIEPEENKDTGGINTGFLIQDGQQIAKPSCRKRKRS